MLIIDPKEIREGTCHIRVFGVDRVAVCMEDGKIKIFMVMAGKFTGRELADGRIWRRVCQDCRAILSISRAPVGAWCFCGSRNM